MPKKKQAIISTMVRKEVLPISREYSVFLKEIKERIRNTRIRAALAADRYMLSLYWSIGRDIVDRQNRLGWGQSVVKKLSCDLRDEFPDLEGFSERNLWRMRAFYLAYSEKGKKVPQSVAESNGLYLPQTVADIPWGHHVMLLEKVKSEEERKWYAQMVIEHGWGRDVLSMQVKMKLHKRQGKAITNFSKTLPKPQSDLASQSLKDPYLFNFISSDEAYRERELEKKLIQHIEKFLLELGAGFSLVGRQVNLKIGDKDYYIDLLFYHLKLRCYTVIELKASRFQPEFAGKLNFYLSAVDDLMRHPDDNPTIGLLLCKGKNKIEVEYALSDINKPVGVADWEAKIVKTLPKKFKGSLPTVKELEAELMNDIPLKKLKK